MHLKRLSSSTRLNLNLLKKNEEANDEEDVLAGIEKPNAEGNGDETNSGKNADMPAWVRSLSSWQGPRRPLSSSANTSFSETENEEKEYDDDNQPPPITKDPKDVLANLINFENILSAREGKADISTVENFSALEKIGAWDGWLSMLKTKVEGVLSTSETTDSTPSSTELPPSKSKIKPSSSSSFSSSTEKNSEVFNLADSVLQEVSKKVEDMLSEAQSVVYTPSFFQNKIQQGRQFLSSENDIIEEAKQTALSVGLDDTQAVERANETISFVNSLVTVADTVLRYGYIKNEVQESDSEERSNDATAGDAKAPTGLNIASKITDGAVFPTQILEGDGSITGDPLLADIPSAGDIPIEEYGPAIFKAAEMASLSAAVYEETIPRCFDLGHSVVAEGVSANVRWIVTDSIGKDIDFFRFPKGHDMQTKPVHTRTITIRGFDASDEQVDRIELFTTIFALKSQPLQNSKVIEVHSGIMSLAEAIYNDISKYIDWSGPSQRIVFNGHSIGGSIATLLMVLLTKDRGVAFAKEKVVRVFAFGSPPVLKFSDEKRNQDRINPAQKNEDIYSCSILAELGLPASILYSYIQPWDPIVRFFSEIDGFYPFIDDLGEDGKTLYFNGPPRALRYVTTALVEAWGEGWADFRDTAREGGAQNYCAVGVQHILMPEPIRYLTDRFVSVNVDVPPIDQIIRVSSQDLYPALSENYPLSEFELSTVPCAIRAFIHHFYPAYDTTMNEYSKVKSMQQEDQGRSMIENTINESKISNGDKEEKSDIKKKFLSSLLQKK